MPQAEGTELGALRRVRVRVLKILITGTEHESREVTPRVKDLREI